MGKALSTDDCLTQAREFIARAEAASDPEMRRDYLKIAGELTKLAACLDSRSTGGSPGHDEGTIAPEAAHPTVKLR